MTTGNPNAPVPPLLRLIALKVPFHQRSPTMMIEARHNNPTVTPMATPTVFFSPFSRIEQYSRSVQMIKKTSLFSGIQFESNQKLQYLVITYEWAKLERERINISSE